MNNKPKDPKAVCIPGLRGDKFIITSGKNGSRAVLTEGGWCKVKSLSLRNIRGLLTGGLYRWPTWESANNHVQLMHYGS